MEERLQKILARAGFASRRGSEGLMQEGRVTVNGVVVKELGSKADLSQDDIRVDGVRVKAPGEPVHIVLNKPRGVVTTRRDPAGRPTVMSLVPEVKGLFPVGRLDLTTEGLILLTNDGAFAERVAHPRFEVPRVYHAKVRGVPDAQTLGRLRRGVRIKDEVLAADRVRLVDVDRHAWVEVTLHEGKQHEVKRLLEAVGHPVSKLRRVAFGPVTLRGLEPGQFRSLEPREIAGLLKGEGVPSRALKTTTRRPKRRPRPGSQGRKVVKKTAPARGPGARGRDTARSEGLGTSARKGGAATRASRPAAKGAATRRGATLTRGTAKPKRGHKGGQKTGAARRASGGSSARTGGGSRPTRSGGSARKAGRQGSAGSKRRR